jgi:hypothetical protein
MPRPLATEFNRCLKVYNHIIFLSRHFNGQRRVSTSLLIHAFLICNKSTFSKLQIS